MDSPSCSRHYISVDTSVLLIFLLPVTATTEIYTLSLHDALPISDLYGLSHELHPSRLQTLGLVESMRLLCHDVSQQHRSEEHTSELQSLRHLVCRLLLEKKNKQNIITNRSESGTYRGLINCTMS